LTPRLHESLVRLGTWVPFAPAARMLSALIGVEISEATARRAVERAGEAYVNVQTDAVRAIEAGPPPGTEVPDPLLFSVDGAMVPLLGGEWCEVKTLALGQLGERVWEGGELVVHAQAISYFSRLADAETFGSQALVETYRRGMERAPLVVAVSDGAEWIQGFIDWHRPDARRILDFPHAAQRLNEAAQLVWGQESAEARQWFEAQVHRLKHEGPVGVLAELAELERAHPQLEKLVENRRYLEKREGQMQYPYYREQGWPIGSGVVESGNKLVVEARLKGAGMHWAREHVNPMLGLRNIVCNDRWDEEWAQIELRMRQDLTQRRVARQVVQPEVPRAQPAPAPAAAAAPAASTHPKPERPHGGPVRPAANHPWRRLPIRHD
jgi:hypothetical protein